MYVLSWRTISALTRVLFWCLFPSLLHNSGNKHQNNPLVSAETVRHESTYIILYVSFNLYISYIWPDTKYITLDEAITPETFWTGAEKDFVRLCIFLECYHHPNVWYWCIFLTLQNFVEDGSYQTISWMSMNPSSSRNDHFVTRDNLSQTVWICARSPVAPFPNMR